MNAEQDGTPTPKKSAMTGGGDNGWKCLFPWCDRPGDGTRAYSDLDDGSTFRFRLCRVHATAHREAVVDVIARLSGKSVREDRKDN